eukprot:scaffold3753_cov411-Chaetoceros_neogracile.AAC.12
MSYLSSTCTKCNAQVAPWIEEKFLAYLGRAYILPRQNFIRSSGNKFLIRDHVISALSSHLRSEA